MPAVLHTVNNFRNNSDLNDLERKETPNNSSQVDTYQEGQLLHLQKVQNIENNNNQDVTSQVEQSRPNTNFDTESKNYEINENISFERVKVWGTS